MKNSKTNSISVYNTSCMLLLTQISIIYVIALSSNVTAENLAIATYYSSNNTQKEKSISAT